MLDCVSSSRCASLQSDDVQGITLSKYGFDSDSPRRRSTIVVLDDQHGGYKRDSSRYNQQLLILEI